MRLGIKMKRITLGILFGISNFITAMEIDRVGSERADDSGLMYLVDAIDMEKKETLGSEIGIVNGKNKRKSIRIENNNEQKAAVSLLLVEKPKKKQRKTYPCVVENCSKYFTSVAACNEHINAHFEQSGDHEENDSDSTTDDMVNTEIKRGRKPQIDWSAICTTNDKGATEYPCLFGCKTYGNKSSWFSHMGKKHKRMPLPKIK